MFWPAANIIGTIEGKQTFTKLCVISQTHKKERCYERGHSFDGLVTGLPDWQGHIVDPVPFILYP